MASATMVSLGASQLALCSSTAAASSARAARSPSGSARLLLGARALPQLRPSAGSAGFAQGSRRQFSVLAKASETTQVDAAEATSDLVKTIQESWAKVDDKLAIGGLGFAALIVLWASTGLISAIDKLPLIPGFFEFVGIVFTGWFTYRYLLFKPDREELLKNIDEAKGKITGQ